MKRKLLWRGFVLALPCLIVASCGGDDDTGVGGTPDSGATVDSSTAKDTSTPIEDANDGGSSVDADATADAPIDVAFDAYDSSVSLDDAGTPAGPTLLLSDTTANRIDLLSLTGTVLKQYSSPVQKVTGVSHDRRLRNGFFVIGRDTPASILKVSWAGATVATIINKFSGTPVRGLDHWRHDAGSDGDILAFLQFNGNVEGAQGIFATDGGQQFSSGFYNGVSFNSGYYGISWLNFSEAANEMLLWAAHNQPDASTTIERWRTASIQATIFLPNTIKNVRGLARGVSDDFWVVDGTNNKVVHVNANGVVLDSFNTPGTDPGGLSFDPGL